MPLYFLFVFNLQSYVIFTGKPCRFFSSEEESKEEVKWLYHSSCNKSHSDLAVASGPHIDMLYKGRAYCISKNNEIIINHKRVIFFLELHSHLPHMQYKFSCTSFKGPVLPIMLHAPLLLFWFSQERGVYCFLVLFALQTMESSEFSTSQKCEV